MTEEETQAALDAAVAEGLMESFVGPDGVTRYRLTQAGIARAESLIQTGEGAEFWARLTGSTEA